MVAAAAAAAAAAVSEGDDGEGGGRRSQCLFGKTKAEEAAETAKKEAEEKFASYWPRNIMILFGPP